MILRNDDVRRVGASMRDAAEHELGLTVQRAPGAWTERGAERCRLAAAWALLTDEQRKLLTWALADQDRAIARGNYRDTLNEHGSATLNEHGSAALSQARTDLLELSTS